jgi:hypothetical protein
VRRLSGVCLWSVALLLVCGLLGCADSAGAPPEPPGEPPDVPPDVPPNVSAPPLTRLSAEGTEIVDAEGNVVVLKGVNLGGWLFNETWMTQIDYSVRGRIHMLGVQEGIGEEVERTMLAVGRDDAGNLDVFIPALAEEVGEAAAAAFRELVLAHLPSLYTDSDLPLRRKLVERFGEEARDELLDIFQAAWITEADIAWIAAQGFNVVRVPIGYRNLILGPDLDKPERLDWNERTWARISDVLDWCETHRIYAVLDIQESPGGHNAFAGAALLYSDERMQEMTVAIWVEFSQRYRDRDIVAAYSLLAEPFGAPTARARDEMYDKLVTAIRANGDDHLLIIHDGFFGMETLPKPEDMGWEGVVYSSHIFEFDAKDLRFYETVLPFFYQPSYSRGQQRQQVPYYVASFSTRLDEPWAYEAATLLLDWFNESGFSWSVWAYKRIDEPTDMKLWGTGSSFGVIGRLEGDIERPDVYNDDLDTLRERMRGYADLPLTPNQNLLEVLTNAL